MKTECPNRITSCCITIKGKHGAIIQIKTISLIWSNGSKTLLDTVKYDPVNGSVLLIKSNIKRRRRSMVAVEHIWIWWTDWILFFWYSTQQLPWDISIHLIIFYLSWIDGGYEFENNEETEDEEDGWLSFCSGQGLHCFSRWWIIEIFGGDNAFIFELTRKAHTW